jgi:phytoene synthase
MLEARILTPEIKSALQEQIARVRQLQEEAEVGIKFLSPESQPCIELASELYCGIVDEVEKIDFEVFKKRAKTSTFRRVRGALIAYNRALKAR